LNLPSAADAGKRLKCPRCGLRFVVSDDDASSASTVPGQADASEPSTHELPRRNHAGADLPVPVAEGDLRETFNLPLVGAREAERAEVAVAPGTADVAGLFVDDPAPKRRTAADARSKARRCSVCGGVVPLGMSICASCGTDQETGMRIGLEDDLAPSAPRRQPGPPLHVSIIGGLCGVGGLILLLLALIQSVRGHSGLERASWLGLAAVSAWGIFACVDFIRGKSAKMLMLALSVGVIVDLMALIGLPLWEVYGPDFAGAPQTMASGNSSDPDAAPVSLKPPEERLDTQRMTLGIALLVAYAGLSVYLISPPVKRHVHARALTESGAW
jgi:hypothetical protein